MLSNDKKSNVGPLNLAGLQSEKSFSEITGRQDHLQPLGPKMFNSISSKGVESKLTSTTTSEGSENQQQKFFECI